MAQDFERKWNLPLCHGAIDRKHIAIYQPPKSGTIYFNYKKFSIVLLAVTDVNDRFIFCNIRREGSAGDAHNLNHSDLKAYMKVGMLKWPRPGPMTNDTEAMPYFLVGGDTFVLKTWLMKPYSRRGLDVAERIYNYRVSRA